MKHKNVIKGLNRRVAAHESGCKSQETKVIMRFNGGGFHRPGSQNIHKSIPKGHGKRS